MFDPENTNTNQPSDLKFKVGDREYDVNAAVNKIQHADQHISTLEKELEELRAKLALTEEQRKAQEALNKPQPPTPPVTTTTVDPVEIEARVRLLAEQAALNALSQSQQSSVMDTNLRECTEAAKQMYGDSYQQVLRTKGATLGYTEAEIVELAKSKPAAFRSIFGITVQPKASTQFGSSYTVPNNPQEDPLRQVAKTILGKGSSNRDRTAAIAALLKKG